MAFLQDTLITRKGFSFRQTTPRNLAGWMIQAIENNYDLPASYLDHKNTQRESQSRQLAEERIRVCPICDEKGFRYVSSTEYPNGAMRKCTHTMKIECQYGRLEALTPSNGSSPDALNSPPPDDFPKNEKDPQTNLRVPRDARRCQILRLTVVSLQVLTCHLSTPHR